MSTDPRLAKLVADTHQEENGEDSFDSATFLYDLYKTSTVKEIEHFKGLIAQV